LTNLTKIEIAVLNSTSILNVTTLTSSLADSNATLSINRQDTLTLNSTFPDGNYSINVTAFNQTLNFTAQNSFSLIADGTKPQLSLNATNVSTLKTSDSIFINVTVSDTNINGSDVKVNGLAMSDSAGSGTSRVFNLSTNGTALGCTSEGACTLRFNATDRAGNYNDTLVMNVTIDNLPNVTLISPANGTGQSGSSFSFGFNFTNDNSLSDSNCQLILDGVQGGSDFPADNPLVSGVRYNITKTLTAGVHTWNVNCTESGVGSGLGASAFTVVRDNTNPSIPTLNDPANNSNQTSASFNFNWTAIDELDTSLLCNITLDGATFATNLTSANNTATNLTVNQNNITQGSHTWSVTCRDDASNSNTSLTFAFTYDSAAPTVSLTQPTASTPNGARANGTLTIKYTYTEARPDNATIYLLNATGAVFNSTIITGLTGGIGVNRTDTIVVPANATEGRYTINVTISDLAGNVNSTVIANNTFVDNTNPTPSISISDTTLDQNDVEAATCSATDNFGGNITVKITDTDDSTGRTGVNSTSKNVSTSSTGSKTITCNATDVSGNSALSTQAYTVSSTSSSTDSGSGSGGGGGAAGTIDTQTHTWTALPADTSSAVNLVADTPLTSIIMTTNQNVTNAKVTVTKLAGTTLTAPATKVYRYIEITVQNFPSGSIKEAKIRFKVLKSWLDANGAAEGDIVMARYSGGWIKLTTVKISSTSLDVTFEATTTAFSTFSIYAEPPAAAPTAPPPVTGDNATGAACADECTEGSFRCTDDATESCGDFDDDACLEWGNSTACAEGLVCFGGSCVTPENVTAAVNITGGAPFEFPKIDPLILVGGVGAVVAAGVAIALLKRRGPPSYMPRRIISKGL
jgi:PGF-pre-PGF domain-containing protein